MGTYLRTLILFLRDFCQEAWTAGRKSEKAIREMSDTLVSTDIALRHAGNARHDSAVRKRGALVSAQIHIGISRYPQSGDDGFVIGVIPEGFRPGQAVKAAGVFEQGGAPRAAAGITIDTAGEIRAVVSDQAAELDQESDPTITASIAYLAE